MNEDTVVSASMKEDKRNFGLFLQLIDEQFRNLSKDPERIKIVKRMILKIRYPELYE